ncbi:MAG: hypothetical protein K9G33_00900 [Sneathiella sp.]|nr:hypothetical protein [Sneathiella sp.]
MVDMVVQKYHRVLLQMDAATHCRETMAAAIEIAARLGVGLQGIFIEDSDLVTVGELDFIREFRLSSPIARNLDKLTLDAQLRAMASSVRRQLERAGSRRKVTVGFHAVSGDLWLEQEKSMPETDLIIIEGTGRLHSRLYRTRSSKRSALQNIMRPTLLLKGGKSLTKKFVVVCDSVDAARKGLQAALALSGTGEKEIMLLPYGMAAEDAKKLATDIEDINPKEEKGIKIAPIVVQDVASVLQSIHPADCILVITEWGQFFNLNLNAERLLESRHPLLLLQ